MVGARLLRGLVEYLRLQHLAAVAVLERRLHNLFNLCLPQLKPNGPERGRVVQCVQIRIVVLRITL